MLWVNKCKLRERNQMEKINTLKLSNAETKKLTRKNLRDSLLNKMKVQKFEEITITELVKDAKVSRTAFYKNYKSTDDVLKDIIISINHVILETIGRPFSKDIKKSWYNHLFAVLVTYEEVIKLIFTAGFQSYYLEITNEIILSKNDVSGTKDAYKRLMWNGAFQNILWEWMKKGKKESIEFMADFCYNYFILRKDEDD